MRAFQTLLASWQHRVRAIGADEYFKLAIRRSPQDVPLWAWAIEWNKSYRLIGFLGDAEAMQRAFDGLPKLITKVVERTPRYTTVFRQEHPAEHQDDHFFDLPVANTTPPEAVT